MTRTLAMVQGAVHDALNAITRRYAAYYFEGPGGAGASPDAAVAAAAHTVLVGVIPSFGTPAQKIAALALVEDAYLAALGRGGTAPPRPRGRGGPGGRGGHAGAPQGRRRHQGRPVYAGDGARQVAAASEPRPAEPAHREPGAGPRLCGRRLLPGWGNVTPFTLLSASQFWLPGPPALTSEAYARDYNEVKTPRRPDQRRRARQSRPRSRASGSRGRRRGSRIARAVAQARGLDAWDSARLLALMYLAMADSYIAGFKIRYVYDSWRPVTAIREGDTDGNDATAGDPTWNSLQNTPAVSDYPSTQSTFSGAAAVALAGVLGTDQVAFTVTSGPPFADIKRSFTSFSQAARESADSRIYAGIHFRTACEDGLALGRKSASGPWRSTCSLSSRDVLRAAAEGGERLPAAVS